MRRSLGWVNPFTVDMRVESRKLEFKSNGPYEEGVHKFSVLKSKKSTDFRY